MPDTPASGLRMQGIRRRFGATLALDGVDFEVRAGEIHALVGENGAGKSTLMKILSGADRPDTGAIELNGSPYAPASPLEARRQGVAMIYQELSLAGHLSVADNILLGVERCSLGIIRHRETTAIARNALSTLGHPDIPLDAEARTLSAGQRQLVEIARAIAVGCRVLILDEPTSSLAREDVERLFTLLRRLREQGLAIVYISHFLEEIREIADRVTVLRDGQSVGTVRPDHTGNEEIIRMMLGRRLDQLYPRSPRRAGETILTVKGLHGATKPTDVSLELRAGEIFGIAGLVGAGRTELLRLIFGLDPVRQGHVTVGAVSTPGTPARRLAQGVGMLSEDRKTEGLALSLTIEENILLSKPPACGWLGLIRPAEARRTATPWINRLGIRCRGVSQRVTELSGGNQQKVAIARLLHHDVHILLLDEPTRGIDVASKAQIYELIDQLAVGDPANGRPPRALLVVSSYLPELLGICDRIAVMHRGRLGAVRPAREWTEHTLLAAATGEDAA
jgi:ribose transport system ATP-binding protein